MNQFFEEMKAASPKGQFTVADSRLGFEKTMAQFPPAKDIAVHEMNKGKLTGAWIHAPNAKKEKVIFFLHAGGYTAGSIPSHLDFLGRLSRASGLYIFATHYRLAPEHPYPAALDDAYEGYHWLLEQGYNPDQIVFAGASAGGGLAVALLLKLKAKKEKMPICYIGASPWFDLALTGKTLQTNEGKDTLRRRRLETASEAYLNGHDPKDPYVSPLYGDLTHLPPLYIQVGALELLLDEIERFAAKAKKSGVDVQLEVTEKMPHCWHLYAAKVPEGQKAIEQLGNYIKRRSS